MHNTEALYSLKKCLVDELESMGEKAKNGKMATSDMDLGDKIAHFAKNLDKIIYSVERDEERDGYSRDRGYYTGYGYSSARWPMTPDYVYRDRDSMGRYSRSSDRIADLRDIMNGTTDKNSRERLMQIISDMEREM